MWLLSILLTFLISQLHIERLPSIFGIGFVKNELAVSTGNRYCYFLSCFISLDLSFCCSVDILFRNFSCLASFLFTVSSVELSAVNLCYMSDIQAPNWRCATLTNADIIGKSFANGKLKGIREYNFCRLWKIVPQFDDFTPCYDVLHATALISSHRLLSW